VRHVVVEILPFLAMFAVLVCDCTKEEIKDRDLVV